MNNKPLGGRGHKAPYETKTVRIPVDLESVIEQLTIRYRELIKEDNFNGLDLNCLLSTNDSIKPLTKDEAIEQAKRIIKTRRSARQSLEKFLRILYEDKNINL